MVIECYESKFILICWYLYIVCVFVTSVKLKTLVSNIWEEISIKSPINLKNSMPECTMYP